MPRDLDLSYLDITPDDRDPQAIFDASLAAAQAALPTWVPRNGNVEVVLMEALALAVSDAVYALNRIPPVVLEAVLALYDIPRDTGTQAVGQVTFTFDDNRTLTIPAGTQLQDPVTGLGLHTRDDVDVTASASATGVYVVADDPGSAANQIPSARSLDLIDLVDYTTDVSVSIGLSGGTDAEDDAAYFDRASTVLARVTSSLVVPTHYTAYALQDVRVQRASTVDLWDGASTATAGTDTGYVTVVGYGYGAALAAGVITELETAMQERSAAMIDVNVVGATVVTQAVTVDVVALPGYASGDVQAAVEDALTSFLSTATWGFGDTIHTTELIAVIGNVEGVDYVDTLTTPASDVTLDIDEIAQAGTLTVTVL